jgi:hypothetical protein
LGLLRNDLRWGWLQCITLIFDKNIKHCCFHPGYCKRA